VTHNAGGAYFLPFFMPPDFFMPDFIPAGLLAGLLLLP